MAQLRCWRQGSSPPTVNKESIEQLSEGDRVIATGLDRTLELLTRS